MEMKIEVALEGRVIDGPELFNISHNSYCSHPIKEVQIVLFLTFQCFFFPHLKQGLDLFIFYKEFGVFVDFTVQNLQAKPGFSKDYEVNVGLIAIIKSRGFVSAESLLFLSHMFLGNKQLVTNFLYILTSIGRLVSRLHLKNSVAAELSS